MTRARGGRPPERKFRVLFLGAGASKAAGLPLTEELLQHIWPREHESVAVWEQRRTHAVWKRDLAKAVTVVYPDGGSDGYRPPVSEFFTLLEVIERVHAGRERLALSTQDLLRDLRGEISAGLATACAKRWSNMAKSPHYQWLKRTGRPHVVITSNWDTLVEQAALRAGLNVVLGWPKNGSGNRLASLPTNTLVVLKLHGSTDWGLATDACRTGCRQPWKYDRLDVPITSGRQRRQTSIDGSEEVVRYRSVDAPVASDRAGRGFDEPLMATMAAGKDYFIQGPIAAIWDDAYWSLSRAKTLDIIGYSFPADDLELRTLLRLTTRKPADSSLADDLELGVCNPSPDTHDRARSLLGGGLNSSYVGAGSWKPTK